MPRESPDLKLKLGDGPEVSAKGLFFAEATFIS